MVRQSQGFVLATKPVSMNNFYVRILGHKKAAALGFCLLFLSINCFAEDPGERPLTLTCPNHKFISAPSNACTATLNFNSLVWSSTVPLTDTLFTPGPGTLFSIGNTVVTLTVTEVGGGISTCNFVVTVNENTQILNCKNNVLVDLDSDCIHMLEPVMVLQAPLGCPANLTVTFVSGQGSEIPALVTANFAGTGLHTYKVKNTVGGQSCTGTFKVNEATLPMSISCPEDVTIECNQPLDPEGLGTPTFFSCLDNTDITTTYLDSFVYSICDGDNIAFQLLRKWKVTDIFNNQRLCTQYITGRKPMLSEVLFPFDYTFSCEAGIPYQTQTNTGITGEPMLNNFTPASTGCDFSVNHTDHVTNICGASYEVERIWTITDLCDNTQLNHSQVIHVLDNEPPVVSLPDTIFVSTSNFCDDIAHFPPAIVTGECSTYTVVMTTPWGLFPTNGGVVQVNTLPGSYPISYKVTDACSNSTIVNMTLTAKPGLIVSCPPDTTIGCSFYSENIAAEWAMNDSTAFDVIGLPRLFANCDFTRKETLVVDIDDCGNGTVVRTMGIKEAPAQCIQHVQISHLPETVVEFPANLNIACTDTPFDAGEPVITNPCPHVIISHSDVVGNSPNACYQILRTWVVQDTCSSVGGNTIPEMSESQLDSLVCDLDGDGDCDTHTFRDAGDGYIQFQQIISVTDTVRPIFPNGCTVPDACLDLNLCDATVTIPTPEVQDCSPVTLLAEFKKNGFWLNASMPILHVVPGNYEVRYTATDKCFKQKICTTNVVVKDCQPPVAVCDALSSLELKASGELTVVAADFNNSSHDNCTGTLKFSFTANTQTITKIYDCSNVGLNTTEIWVTDISGNQSFCTTTIEILDNNTDCGALQLAGHIFTELDLPASNVLVSTSMGSDVTDVAGNYDLGSTLGNPDLEIIPSNEADPTNGVTTFDVVTIRKHILGNGMLDSPYKIIAADANLSNSVTTFDLVVITKIILGNQANFMDNKSWRFVPDYFIFPNPNDPFSTAFPESIVITGNNPISNLDFIAIKVGDINNSATPSFQGGSGEKFKSPPNRTLIRN